MIRTRLGLITEVRPVRPGFSEVIVNVEGTAERAVNYDELTGTPARGDKVILNTTALYKKLGTGGTHFVMANLSHPNLDSGEEGHIMKMRYAPCQVKVFTVEEEDHPEHTKYNKTESLDGTPVILGTLHSMVGPAAAMVHKLTGGRARVAYLMTDGAALPISLSNILHELRNKGLISSTVTCGHAFGGDYETVTTYSGLLAARGVAEADIIIAAMGPGIVGTSSRYGFTGLEQGELVNAVNVLGGTPVAIPRISFADSRERHRGLSHHTRTALGIVAQTPCTVTLPSLLPHQQDLVQSQLNESGISQRHHVVTVDNSSLVLDALKEYNLRITTMGRSPDRDAEFFMAAGAAGIYAAQRYLNAAGH